MSKGTESGRVVRMWRLTYDGQHVWLTEPFSLSMLADHLPPGHSITIEAADLNPAEAEAAAQQSLARLEAAAQGVGVEENLWAIGKHVDALRGQLRWGVGNIEQAFRGYAALPEHGSGLAWWDVLGVPVNASRSQIDEAYRIKAKLCHPDVGGSHEQMTALNAAYQEAATSVVHAAA